MLEPISLSENNLSTSAHMKMGLLTEEFLKFIQENPIDDIDEKEKQYILERAQELLL
jgi:hypothetical protein